MKRRHSSPSDRLTAYSTPGPMSALGTECILWTGYRRPDGYGDVSIQGKLRRAHRVAYEVTHGTIPAALDVDHMCHNVAACDGGLDCPHRLCINPEHLRLVPRLVNARAGRTGSTLTGVVGEACEKGHAMTAENTITAFGRRWCAECKTERKTRLRAN